ncbi:MAG: glycosyltransferase family 4 protein [Chloroflexi bacterium]|nr:glycosyltransferase family 4 protein [Chloroflexota bacterium]
MIGPLPPEYGGLLAGGVATHTAELVQALGRLGVEVRLLATNVRQPSLAGRLLPVTPLRQADGWLGLLSHSHRAGVWAAARLGVTLVRHPRLLPSAWHAGRRALLAQMLEYRGFLRAARPDVVHVQHPLDRHLVVRLLAELDGLATPVVVTLHSFFREHSNETIYGLMQPNLRFGDRFIAVNEHVREEAVQLGADPARIRVIRSGVDTARFRPQPIAQVRDQLGLAGDEPLVVFVGNLEPRKAVDQLVLAMERVRAALPAARLAIVGSGASAGVEDQEPRLRALVAELGLDAGVRFIGAVSSEDLVRWYNAADVFVLPSYSEGQGIVALEAMSCGRPVVASAVGGLRDTITDGHDGFLVPPGAPPALAERLTALLRDPATRQRVGEQARRTVEARFSWTRAAEATLDVYRELVAEAPFEAHHGDTETRRVQI